MLEGYGKTAQKRAFSLPQFAQNQRESAPLRPLYGAACACEKTTRTCSTQTGDLYQFQLQLNFFLNQTLRKPQTANRKPQTANRITHNA
jgi:hypothetical protein